MKVKFAATPSWAEDNSIITIEADIEESISVGQSVKFELTDESWTERTIVSMEKWVCPEDGAKGKWVKVDFIKNGETAEATIENIQSNTIQTTSMPRPETFRKWAAMINLTPYKEIKGGEESIYDHVQEGYEVPDKVIAYLRTTKPFLMSPGIYNHPFKEGQSLLGPYLYTDDTFYWDRDTWKYVVKYGLTLPQEFIDHVMSDEGTKFIEQQIESNESWTKAIREWKKKKGFICLLPDDAGDRELADF